MGTPAGGKNLHHGKAAQETGSKEGVFVLLTVTGKQTDPDGNIQESTSVYRAVCRRSGKGLLFTYSAEEAAATLFLSRDLAWMQRGRSESSRMVFDPSGTVTDCDYETAYGIIPMQIRTDRISVLAGGRRGREEKGTEIIGRGLQARIRYSLLMGPEYELFCSVTIKVQQI